MNDKDKEAFEKWWMEGFKGMSDMEVIKYVNVGKQTSLHGWQAACEYKQKEIDELEESLATRLAKSYIAGKDLSKIIQKNLTNEVKKLQAENAKLRECLKFYAEPWERGELDGELLVRKLESYDSFVEVHYKARQVLKELEGK